ncbi:MAG: hypothetical protein PHX54_10815 [Lentimicrobiaceae bacterium]|nr:hypothetical protein [Lentimicrobiaceae bacterium]
MSEKKHAHSILIDLFDAYQKEQISLQYGNDSILDKQRLIRKVILQISKCDLVQIKMSHSSYEEESSLHLTSILDQKQVEDLIITLLSFDKHEEDGKSLSPGRFWARYYPKTSTCLGMAVGKPNNLEKLYNEPLWFTCSCPENLTIRDVSKKKEISDYKLDRKKLENLSCELNSEPNLVSPDTFEVQFSGGSDVDSEMMNDFRKISSKLLAYPICVLSIPVFFQPRSGNREAVFYSVELVWLQPPLPEEWWVYACDIALFVSKTLPQLVVSSTNSLFLCWEFAYKKLNKGHPKFDQQLPKSIPFHDIFKEDQSWQSSIKALFQYDPVVEPPNFASTVGVWDVCTVDTISVNTFIGILKEFGINIKSDKDITSKRIKLPGNPGFLFLYYLLDFLDKLGQYNLCRIFFVEKRVFIKIEISNNSWNFAGVFKSSDNPGTAIKSFRKLLTCQKFEFDEVQCFFGNLENEMVDEVKKWGQKNMISNEIFFGNEEKSHLMPIVSEQFEGNNIILFWNGVVNLVF